jgi:hypothetical protein
MSDTPRTDAELKRICEQLDGGEDNATYVLSQLGAHACMLEREVERLRAVAEQQPGADDAPLLADGNAEMADMLRIQHAIILELRAEVERLAQDYVRACKLAADMHAAATGRPGEGPRLGVVEDVAAVRAEVERLRVDAERWRYFVTHCQWFRHHDEDGSYSTMSTRLPYDADQSCVATRNAAIDAALAKEKGPLQTFLDAGRDAGITHLGSLTEQEPHEMTRDEITEMAREALVVPFFLKETNDESMIRLRDFAALVVAAEREAACRIVTGLCISDNNAREICEAIRARSKA